MTEAIAAQEAGAALGGAAPITTGAGAPATTTETVMTGLTAGTWRESLPADLKTNASLAKFGDVNALSKSYLELEAFRGAHLPKPNDAWTEKEWSDLYGKLGRPETPDKYGFNKDTIPKELHGQYNEEGDKVVAQIMHKAGLTSAQAKAVRDGYAAWQLKGVGVASEGHAKAEQARQAALTELQRSYGDDWKNALDGGDRVLQKLGGEKTIAWAKEKGLTQDPTFIDLMVKAGATLRDHQIITGVPQLGGGNFLESAAAAKSEIERMKADPETVKALMNPRHPGNAAAEKKMHELFQAAYPKS
jgi:hypothetical protein